MKNHLPGVFSVSHLYSTILRGDVSCLAKAITLSESEKPTDQKKAGALLTQLLPHTGQSIRLGITGSPGVGKSTFIDAFGKYATSLGKKVAVLAVDPSSEKTKGSILGDKTRMEELSRDALAFIRPTASRHTLGGVAEKTREAILLCEAAGYEIIIVETVGVGQSETAVHNMVDFFLLLQLAGAGDELQGIKKGIMEMADGVVITKADGDNEKRARQAQVQFQHALHLFQLPESGWRPRVLTASATQKKGIADVWKMIEEFWKTTSSSGFFEEHRRQQQLIWFRQNTETLMRAKMLGSKKIIQQMKTLEQKIKEGKIIPSVAAQKIIQSL